MKQLMKTLLVLIALGVGMGAMAQDKPAAPTIASVVDREITTYEKLLVDVAEAMPEEKYSFTPASLGIKGGSFEGVRTFAELIKHTASANYFFWASLTGDAAPASKGPNGPDDIKTKAEIIKYLKDSFAQGHKAAATFSAENVVSTITMGKNEAPRLHLAMFGVIHAADEYGQMVEYLRMNGIVPPASRPK